jgi:hypothetical protein
MGFYQNGIVRFYIEETGTPFKRFRASDEFGVEEDQLFPVENLENYIQRSDDRLVIRGLQSDNGQEYFDYYIYYSPFRIEQRILGKVTMVINSHDSLFMENTEFLHGEPQSSDRNTISEALDSDECANPIFDEMRNLMPKERFTQTIPRTVSDYSMSIAMGFLFVDTEHLFGIPQRQDKFKLDHTRERGPYRLYN